MSATYNVAMATGGVSFGDGDDASQLFDASPDRRPHTSAAAELGLLLGLFSFLSSPFSVMHALTLGAAGLAFAMAFVGLASTSRPDVAGSALVPLGLALSFTALVLVGLRYLGLDTAFGDDLVPTLRQWLAALNSWIPQP